MNRHLQRMVEIALSEGASRADVILPRQLVIEDHLAGYCLQPKCPNYGLSFSCPPHVGGPDVFRGWRDTARHALAVRIDVPATVLHSDERFDVMRLLHELVAKIELKATGLGYKNSKGFAGGSCKKLYCNEYDQCLRLSPQGTCRHPLQARPSLSGFGVNVAEMLAAGGWRSKEQDEENASGDTMSWVAGLVLISR